MYATCYPAFMDKMPSDVTILESRVVIDGRAFTSRGSGMTKEFALALVDQLYGKDKADEIAGPMVRGFVYFFLFRLREKKLSWVDIFEEIHAKAVLCQPVSKYLPMIDKLYFGVNSGAMRFAIENQAVNEATFRCLAELGWKPHC